MGGSGDGNGFLDPDNDGSFMPASTQTFLFGSGASLAFNDTINNTYFIYDNDGVSVSNIDVNGVAAMTTLNVFGVTELYGQVVLYDSITSNENIQYATKEHDTYNNRTLTDKEYVDLKVYKDTLVTTFYEVIDNSTVISGSVSEFLKHADDNIIIVSVAYSFETAPTGSVTVDINGSFSVSISGDDPYERVNGTLSVNEGTALTFNATAPTSGTYEVMTVTIKYIKQ
jgi:hypothetical protein